MELAIGLVIGAILGAFGYKEYARRKTERARRRGVDGSKSGLRTK